jgi:hypothetical protein
METWGTVPPLLTSALDGGGQLHAPAALHLGKQPQVISGQESGNPRSSDVEPQPSCYTNLANPPPLTSSGRRVIRNFCSQDMKVFCMPIDPLSELFFPKNWYNCIK